MESVRFTDFTMLRNARRLMRGGRDVAVGARAFDLLDLLVNARDRIVSRDEIMETVWPGTVVGENNLNVQVANLRRVLGADAIVTIPGRGLRFALEVAHAGPLALGMPDRPSIVVLPFADLRGDPELAWLADGFVEDTPHEDDEPCLFCVQSRTTSRHEGRPICPADQGLSPGSVPASGVSPR